MAAPTPGSGYTMEMEMNAIPAAAAPGGRGERNAVSAQQANATPSMTLPSGTYADMMTSADTYG